LLRLVADSKFHRVRGEAAIALNARIVCASNRDLPAEVRAGRFREDLLYRMNVVTIEVPPLRERAENIQWFLEHFLADAAREVDTTFRGISSLAEDAALAHSWPGNIRELRNRVERAVALGVGEWIMPADLFPEARRQPCRDGKQIPLSLALARDAAERCVIDRALRQTAGQIAEAAKLLGVSRTTLWERMRRFGLAAE
jgi:DNA-binding NtrC family response regulator